MLTGVILAGGKKDTIKGTLKSFLPLKGERIIDYQINEMKKICSEIMIVTATPMPYLAAVPSDIRILTDFYKGKGVLGGMYSALSLSKNPYFWIVGCGMPYISSKAAMFMLSKLEKTNGVSVMVNSEVGPEPLHGIYSQTLLPKLQGFDWSHDRVTDFLYPDVYLELAKGEFHQRNITSPFLFSIKDEQELEALCTGNRGYLTS
ncbi:molybdenum cofactor guanylyltransferase [Bacillus sp. AK128]